MRASLYNYGTPEYKAGKILLVVLASLPPEEVKMLIHMIRNETSGTIESMIADIEPLAALKTSAMLITRRGYMLAPTMREDFADFLGKLGMYIDANIVVPPEALSADNESLGESLTPKLLMGFVDKAGDVLDSMRLIVSEEYDPSAPPLLDGGGQSIGYRNSVFQYLEGNQLATPGGMAGGGNPKTPSGGVSTAAWITALSMLAWFIPGLKILKAGRGITLALVAFLKRTWPTIALLSAASIADIGSKVEEFRSTESPNGVAGPMPPKSL